MSSTILHVVISEKVNRSNRTASVTWQVPTRQPLLASWQAGDLSQRVGADVALSCELCFYTGGVVGGLIDLSLSPETLGLTRANAVYLRPMQHASLGALGGMAALSHEEVRRLHEDAKRLSEVLLPRLKPDDPCPVCAHSRNERGRDRDSAGDRSGRGGGDGASAGSGGGGNYRNAAPATFTYKPSVAVQCGIASGIDQPPIYIGFGPTGARMAAGDPRDAGIGGGGGSGGGGGAGGSSSGGGGGRRSDRDIIHDLQMTIEDLKVRNAAQSVEIKEARRELKALEQWRADHRCEASTNVGALRTQIEVLQENLRELMRGRQEVFAVLKERRRAGIGGGGGGPSDALKGAPYNYAPFATSLPELTYVDPHTLLAKGDDPAIRGLVDAHLRTQRLKKAVTSGGGSGSPTNSANQARNEAMLREVRDRDYNNPNASSAELAGRRPTADGNGSVLFSGLNSSVGNAPTSAAAAEAQRRRDLDIEVCGQNCLPGHCQLRISTTGGEPFIVQRKIGSHILHGKNMVTLMSLDGIVTDEIFVEELEMVAAPGRCGLVLGTRSYEWQLSFSAAERTNWMQWLYALNPWLTPHRPGALELAASL